MLNSHKLKDEASAMVGAFLISKKWEDKTMNEMPELKPGMVVRVAKRIEPFFVIGNTAAHHVACVDANHEHLFPHNDVVEVYQLKHPSTMRENGDIVAHYYLLWLRPKPKEMTVAEISKELGYPVKIID